MENKMEAWYEEDEQVFVHPRDPYHRVDVLQSSRHVKVRVNGEVVAGTERPRVLFETGVAAALLHPTRGRARGGARGEREDHKVPLQRRRVVLFGRGGGRAGR